jgi:hypothetical protein
MEMFIIKDATEISAKDEATSVKIMISICYQIVVCNYCREAKEIVIGKELMNHLDKNNTKIIEKIFKYAKKTFDMNIIIVPTQEIKQSLTHPDMFIFNTLTNYK